MGLEWKTGLRWEVGVGLDPSSLESPPVDLRILYLSVAASFDADLGVELSHTGEAFLTACSNFSACITKFLLVVESPWIVKKLLCLLDMIKNAIRQKDRLLLRLTDRLS